MNFEPRDVFRKLEYDKVIELLVKEALTPMAAEQLAELVPTTNFTSIDLSLREIRDYKLALEKNDRIPIATFQDVRDDLKRLEIEGYTLQSESFQAILRILQLVRDLYKYFGQTVKREIYPKIYDVLRPHSFDEGLMKAINAVFD